MEKIVLTSGKEYIDIDGLACALAYKDLLVLAGKQASAVLIGKLNQSVTKTIRSYNLDFEKNLPKMAFFVVVDVSEPSHLPEEVLVENVIELFLGWK